MKVAFASDDQVSLATHTGRCAGFVVCGFSGGTWTREDFRENPQSRFHREHVALGGGAEHTHAHGEGYEGAGNGGDHDPGAGRHSHAGVLMVLGDCSALVTRGLGPRLVRDLNSAGLRVHVTDLETVVAAMGAFARGELPIVGPDTSTCGSTVDHEH